MACVVRWVYIAVVLMPEPGLEALHLAPPPLGVGGQSPINGETGLSGPRGLTLSLKARRALAGAPESRIPARHRPTHSKGMRPRPGIACMGPRETLPMPPREIESSKRPGTVVDMWVSAIPRVTRSRLRCGRGKWHGRLVHAWHGHPGRANLPRQGQDGPGTHGQDARASP